MSFFPVTLIHFESWKIRVIDVRFYLISDKISVETVVQCSNQGACHQPSLFTSLYRFVFQNITRNIQKIRISVHLYFLVK
jgi:hypothetical protein